LNSIEEQRLILDKLYRIVRGTVRRISKPQSADLTMNGSKMAVLA